MSSRYATHYMSKVLELQIMRSALYSTAVLMTPVRVYPEDGQRKSGLLQLDSQQLTSQEAGVQVCKEGSFTRGISRFHWLQYHKNKRPFPLRLSCTILPLFCFFGALARFQCLMGRTFCQANSYVSTTSERYHEIFQTGRTHSKSKNMCSWMGGSIDCGLISPCGKIG